MAYLRALFTALAALLLAILGPPLFSLSNKVPRLAWLCSESSPHCVRF